MRFLICRTDAIGDLLVTLPVQNRILANDQAAEIFWLVREETAPVLDGLPNVSGVLRRRPESTEADLADLIRGIAPDALLNISHRDKMIIPAAKMAGAPIRVARPRGLKQILFATHLVWSKRSGSGRHESQHALDFLKPFGWANVKPAPPSLAMASDELDKGKKDLGNIPHPRLGIILRGSGSGASPSPQWWKKMLSASKSAGWNPIVLSPPEESPLPPADLRGLMGRLCACDAIIGPSTGPTHLAAALDRPTLCLMGRRISHGPDRWAPLGHCARAIQYTGAEDDLGSGMDRLSFDDALAALKELIK
jgi:ADP-heptose:LPS heptosyltransferase